MGGGGGGGNQRGWGGGTNGGSQLQPHPPATAKSCILQPWVPHVRLSLSVCLSSIRPVVLS